eukprot:PLAT13363.1.p1 GENE.PLAT13363.1~~PLAT13363.1.p1  ORF type:complete len:315 (-),score=80.38 PLAT13363.1:69-1013(-)
MLARRCSFHLEFAGEHRLPLLTAGSGPKRVFLLFGEHARELISSETALAVANRLCDPSDQLAARVLASSTIKLVPVANPLGRRLVEKGDLCLRANEHGVDLNRNWDAHWQPQGTTFPGPAPWSEAETRQLKAWVDAFHPQVFITIHSGTLGLYAPYAYRKSLPVDDPRVPPMMAALRVVNDTFCRCPTGPAGLEVGYLCPGTCLDYVYDKLGAPFAYAVEIYSDDQATVRQQWADKLAGLPSLDGDADFSSATAAFAQLTESIAETQRAKAAAVEGMTPEECFKFFNPPPEKHAEVTAQWSSALLTLVDLSKLS